MTVSWADIANAPTEEEKVALWEKAGLLVRDRSGELVPSEGVLRFLDHVERRIRTLVPLFDHVAGEAECFHRPTTLGEPQVTAADADALAREADYLMRVPERYAFTIAESMAGNSGLQGILDARSRAGDGG